jgi:hypothetical protein
MRRENLSPSFTTRWGDTLIILALLIAQAFG